MDKEKKIFVFADFQPYHEEIIGTIYVSQTRGKEFYSFEYDQKWLEKGNMILDPDLQMYKGRQYIHDDKKIFGVFADSCPDRWGQRLMKRREELRAKNAGEKPRKLLDRHELAVMCGLNVPEAKAEKFSRLGTTFLVKRFDRIESRRIHFSSAMTMLGKKDGANAADGSSYLEIVSFLKANGATPKKDIQELWKRIVFSMAVSNTDDHFRNHGFILEEKGWVLSPMYDVNPDIYGEFLSPNVDEDNSAIDFDLAIEAAPYYEISTEQAKKNVTAIRKTVADNWRSLAGKYGISRGEIERMCPAFQGDV